MKKTVILLAIIVLIVGALFQVSLRYLTRSYAQDGCYCLDISSEKLMQTVSIEDLRDAPLKTLYNIHIQPPALDIIRAILVQIWPAPNSATLLRHVDFLLYQLWSLLYGLVGLLIFLWIFKLTDIKIAIFATVIFLLHPAYIC